MAGRRATSCAATPFLNSEPYPAKHKILPLSMRGVTAYYLLNPLEEPHRVRGESAKGIKSERDEHVLILYASFFVLSPKHEKPRSYIRLILQRKFLFRRIPGTCTHCVKVLVMLSH
ncbi:hypothetical protein Hanom_Chr11g00985951 [Helianthus anomalus]